MEFWGRKLTLFCLTLPNYICLCLQALLEVVNDLFEEQTDLEKIVKKIMHRAQTLLKCERCSVLLLEDIESPVSVFVFVCECVCVCVCVCGGGERGSKGGSWVYLQLDLQTDQLCLRLQPWREDFFLYERFLPLNVFSFFSCPHSEN